MLNIALFGYGQMGKMLEKLAPEYNCRIVAIFDPLQEKYNKEIDEDTLSGVDVCLDFSLPTALLNNAEKIAASGKHLVIGTTGWYDKLSTVENLARLNNIGIIYAGNFSLGMNLFLLITKYAGELISESNSYDVFGYEMHHNKKADSPSGTARELTEIICSSFPEKNRAQFKCLERKIDPDEFHFASVRGGYVPGTHVIDFDSPFDTIELKHTARTREGFAVGALKAAHWIKGQKGLFEFRKVFLELIKS